MKAETKAMVESVPSTPVPCPRCTAKILPGQVHSCAGADYFVPTLVSIEQKLERLCQLLEGGLTKTNGAAAEDSKPKTMAAAASVGAKARNRETRAAQS
jgi:hypothetical protein